MTLTADSLTQMLQKLLKKWSKNSIEGYSITETLLQASWDIPASILQLKLFEER